MEAAWPASPPQPPGCKAGEGSSGSGAFVHGKGCYMKDTAELTCSPCFASSSRVHFVGRHCLSEPPHTPPTLRHTYTPTPLHPVQESALLLNALAEIGLGFLVILRAFSQGMGSLLLAFVYWTRLKTRYHMPDSRWVGEGCGRAAATRSKPSS
jgi:hypothetical protein